MRNAKTQYIISAYLFHSQTNNYQCITPPYHHFPNNPECWSFYCRTSHTMSKKRFLWTTMLITGFNLIIIANQNPPLLLLEDESTEQTTAQPQPEQQNINTTTTVTTSAPATELKQTATQPATIGGLILIDEAAEEAQRKAAEEAARIEAERKAAEEAARIEAERKAAEEAASIETERKAAEEAASIEAQRKNIEEAASNQQSKDITDKMIEALLETQKMALQQAAKADSILQVQRQQEQRLRELEARQNEQQPTKAIDTKPVEEPQQETPVVEPLKEKQTVFQRYYSHSGQNMLSIISVGYSTYFQVGPLATGPATEYAFKRHMLNFEIFEWRAKCFGMQMFNFEMGINTPNPDKGIYMFERGGYLPDERVEATARTMWFAYKPAVKFYIPCTKWLAIELYGGVEVDLTYAWNFINSSYYAQSYAEKQQVPEQNYFLSAYGGAGLMFTGIAPLPLEIKAEYRHPVQGNTALVPQGIYISAQLHLAAPIKKK